MLLRVVGITIVAGLSLSGMARADELQARVLAGARATRPDAYSFRRTIVTEKTGSDRAVQVEQYDPNRPPANRWSLVSIQGHAPTASDLATWRKGNRGPLPSYAEMAKWFGTPATRSDTAPGYVTYHFARLPAGSAKVGSHDASADTQADAIVNVKGSVPFVERIRLGSSTAFRMMLIVSVQNIAVTGRFTLLSNGSVVPADNVTVVSGSILGKAGQVKKTVTFSDFQPAR